MQVRARTIAGLSTSPAMVELITYISLGKYEILEKKTVVNYAFFLSVPSKPKFIVTYRATNFFNVSFDPTIMPIPGSLYFVQYKEDEKGLSEEYFLKINNIILNFKDGQAIYKRTYAVSNDRTIIVSPLEPGKTYITILVAGDGIRAETRSDPQYITTLGKGMF